MRGSWRAIALYPPSWVAMTAVLVAVGAILSVLEPSPVLSVVVVVVGIVAVMAWPVTLSATGTLAQISAPSEEPSTISEAEVLALAERLDRLDGRRPSDQLREIRRSHDRIEFLLDRRRAAGDLVYERYRPDAERIYLAVIARLQVVLTEAESSDVRAGIGSEPATGTSVRPTGDLAVQTGVAYDSRVTGGPEEGSETASADDPLAQNDVAIAAMERASRELGSVQVGQSTRDATDALESIRRLGESPGP